MRILGTVLVALTLNIVVITGCVSADPAVGPIGGAPTPPQAAGQQINSFADCVAAGFPVLRTLPARCRAADGRMFVDDRGAGVPSDRMPSGGDLPAADEGGACKNLCGDGKCQEMVCMAVGCPCAESPMTCPADCAKR